MKRPFRLRREPHWPTIVPFVPLEAIARCLEVAAIRRHSGNGCWLWMGRTNKAGYGLVSVPSPVKGRSKSLIASRCVMAVQTGRWPDADQLVCHHCDRTSCVRPDHLYIGTFESNARDRRRDISPLHRQASKGKVDDETIREVLRLYFGPEGNGRAEFLAKHGWSVKSLARRYSVGDIVIRHFVYGKTRFPFFLNGKQMTEIWAMYFGRFGQGSVCRKGTNVARWTVKSIAAHLKVSASAVEHACVGDRFQHLKRPSLDHLKPDVRVGPSGTSD